MAKDLHEAKEIAWDTVMKSIHSQEYAWQLLTAIRQEDGKSYTKTINDWLIEANTGRKPH